MLINHKIRLIVGIFSFLNFLPSYTTVAVRAQDLNKLFLANHIENNAKIKEAELLNEEVVKLYQQGQYQQAITLAEKILSIYQNTLGKNHLEVAISFNNLGELHRTTGDFLQAESLFIKSLNILREILGENDPTTANALSNLGTLYQEQGDYHNAELLFKQALETLETTVGKNHPDTAMTMNNLGILYRSQGNYKQAEILFVESLLIFEEILGKETPEVATLYGNIGGLFEIEKDYETAILFHQEAFNIREIILGTTHPDTAISLNNLAQLYKKQQDYNLAESFLKKGLEISQKILGNNHPNVAVFHNNLSSLYWETNQLPLAKKAFTASTEIQESILTEIVNKVGDESRKQAYLNTLTGTTNAVISFHLNSNLDNPDSSKLALTTILRRKGRVLDALSDIVGTLRERETPEIQNLFDNLAQKRSQLTALFFQGVDEMNPTTYQQLIDDFQKDIRALETDLSLKNAEFKTINQPILLDNIQKAISSDQALLEYILYQPYNPSTGEYGESRYAVYVLNSEGNPVGIDLGKAETIDNLVQEWRNYLTFIANYPDELEEKEAGLSRLAPQLHSLIFEPILPFLKDSTNILVSPDSQLNLIPFAALQDQKGSYLLEKFTFTYLTSGRDLLRFETKFEPQSESVILANPNYSLNGNNNSRTNMENTRGNILPRADLRSLSGCCTPLEGTLKEAEAIIPLLSNPRVYMGNQALVDNIKQIKAPKILHLATHGFFLPDIETVENAVNNSNENPLLRSGLAFAGFNPLENSFDGALTALDASSLNLWGTQLVVLSACQTGLGDIRNGEGVYGLRRAFVLAGAQDLLMSLWDVDDGGTQDLMVNFYQRLMNDDKSSRAQLLRQVQLEMLHSEKYSSPYYWAAFIPSGSWD